MSLGIHADVAQLVRATRCQRVGRGFESLYPLYEASASAEDVGENPTRLGNGVGNGENPLRWQAPQLH